MGSFLKNLLTSVSVFIITEGVYSASSVASGSSSFTNSYYQAPSHLQPISLANVTAAAFGPRDGGSPGGSYGVPVGGYEMGGYGVPAAPAMMYKYQIYPNPPKAMEEGGGWGWGMEEEDDDGGGDFPKELIGLLGLKGLKPLKILKALLFLKKALGIPLFPFLLPLLIPLALIKLVALALPLLLILFFPVIVTPGRAGSGTREIFETETGRKFKKLFEEKMEKVMANLPEDISLLVKKIKGKNNDMALPLSSNRR